MSNYKDLNKLSDSQLRGLVCDITKALGADPKRAAHLTQDPQKLKNLISGMENKDIEALINRAGKDKAKQIYEVLERRGSNG
ncbi:MAG: hypothetical protein IJB65_00930 [Clostridia bacterium]|nr:hypothetical protein [Clostridia bacterium]